MTEPIRAGRRRAGPALLVLMTAGLAGFIAQGKFAPSLRAALGFVLAVFAVTFLVSLAHAIWGEQEPPRELSPDLADSESDARPDYLSR